MLLFGTVAFGMPFILTLYAQQVLGYSAVEFGVGSVVLAVAVTVGAIVAQAAVLEVGFRPVAATGMTLMGAGSLLLTQVSVGGSYFGDIVFGLLVCGPGIGLAFVTATVAALAGVAEHESGLASGLSNTALQIGGALGVAIASTVAVSRSEHFLAANGGADQLVVLNEGFQSAFLAVAVLAGIGLALALLLPGRPRTTPTNGESKWERSSSARTSRSTESSRTRPVWKASYAAAGSVVSATGVAKRRPRSCSRTRWAPRPSCSVGEPTSSSPRGGHLGVANWRTG
jgi:MFS family permease